jgi:transposase
MWTSENRAKYDRDKLRYPSDVTDKEWAHVAPLILPAKRGGRKREANMREVFKASCMCSAQDANSVTSPRICRLMTGIVIENV